MHTILSFIAYTTIALATNAWAYAPYIDRDKAVMLDAVRPSPAGAGGPGAGPAQRRPHRRARGPEDDPTIPRVEEIYTSKGAPVRVETTWTDITLRGPICIMTFDLAARRERPSRVPSLLPLELRSEEPCLAPERAMRDWDGDATTTVSMGWALFECRDSKGVYRYSVNDWKLVDVLAPTGRAPDAGQVRRYAVNICAQLADVHKRLVYTSPTWGVLEEQEAAVVTGMDLVRTLFDPLVVNGTHLRATRQEGEHSAEVLLAGGPCEFTFPIRTSFVDDAAPREALIEDIFTPSCISLYESEKWVGGGRARSLAVRPTDLFGPIWAELDPAGGGMQELKCLHGEARVVGRYRMPTEPLSDAEQRTLCAVVASLRLVIDRIFSLAGVIA